MINDMDIQNRFLENRFGMFIHWGIYAVDGWHEQQLYRQALSRQDYLPQMQAFNPINFAPDEWLDLAQTCGMEYLVFTTKHIDGFCMWDTAGTDYNIMHTPYQQDILAKLAEACERRSFPLGLYYSIADMNHPNYPWAGRRYELTNPEPDDEPDLEKYLAFMKTQVTELCTRYGKLHAFWWDGNQIKIDRPEFNNLIHELQPGILINNRGLSAGDFGTSEREWDTENVDKQRSYTRPIEACNSLGTQSWGYRRDEDYYSLRHLQQSLATNLAKGGNVLLNAGPDEKGEISGKSAQMLQQLGKWFHTVKEAFYECEPASEMTDNQAVLLTRKDNNLYVHLTQPPISEAVLLNPLQTLPKNTVLLNTGEPVETAVDFIPTLWETGQKYLRIKNLPVNSLMDQVIVIRLEFDQLPEITDNLISAEFREQLT